MILITGARGYIGQAVVRQLVGSGQRIAALGAAPPGFPGPTHDWNLRTVPPAEAFEGVTAVLHLAHDWQADDGVNREGTMRLAMAAAAAGVPRFVFASTTSARPDARNRYGRGKAETEAALRQLGETTPAMEVCSARIALVYGGTPRGQYRLMLTLTRRLPVLPMIGLGKEIQPIHVDEVARGLAAILELPTPVDPVYVLGDPTPMRFGRWLTLLRRAQTGRRLVLLPVPLWAALLGCHVLGAVPGAPSVDEERLLGLAGARPMQSAASLAALGLVIEPAVSRLYREVAPRRRRLLEARVLLRHLGGRAAATPGATRRLARGLEQERLPLLGIGRLLGVLPGLIRLIEPASTKAAHRYAQALHLAALVIEADAPVERHPRGGLLRAGCELGLDLLAMPFRVVLSRLVA